MAAPETLKDLASQIIANRCTAEGLQRFVYEGQCMAPILSEGDLVFVKKIPQEKLRLGDIIVFKDEKRNYIHRYLFTRRLRNGASQIITKADRYLKPDPPVSPELFIGKAVRIKTKKKLLELEKTKLSFLSFILGAASFMEILPGKFAEKMTPNSLNGRPFLHQRMQAPKALLEKIFCQL